MAIKNAQQVAQRWASAMSNSTEKIKAGVQAVTVAPTALAAAAVDRQVAGVIRARDSGKTQANLLAVSLQSWQSSFINKGLTRIGTGATNAIGKMTAFMQQFLPAQQAIVAGLPPRGDLNQNIQRAVQMMTQTAGWKYTPQGQ